MARRAYGAHRAMTQADKARNVTEAILIDQAHGQTRTLAHYGIADDSDLGQEIVRRVAVALRNAALRSTQEL